MLSSLRQKKVWKNVNLCHFWFNGCRTFIWVKTFLNSTSQKPTQKWKNLRALTLLRLVRTRENSVLDPLAQQHLDNWLDMAVQFLAYVNWAIAAVPNTDVHRLISPLGFITKIRPWNVRLCTLYLLAFFFFFFLIKFLFL